MSEVWDRYQVTKIRKEGEPEIRKKKDGDVVKIRSSKDEDSEGSESPDRVNKD